MFSFCFWISAIFFCCSSEMPAWRFVVLGQVEIHFRSSPACDRHFVEHVDDLAILYQAELVRTRSNADRKILAFRIGL